MIRLQTEKGEVSISDAALSNITGAAATSCFGVKGMAYRSMTDGLVHLLRREAMSKGVRIIPHEEGDISIELHIVVEHGVNIAAVCRSIIIRCAIWSAKTPAQASAASTFASTA